MRKTLTGLVVFCLAACAVIRPPPGGPEDKEPPRMATTVPAPDSTGVARDIDVRITFSEKLDPESFKNRIVLYPPVEFEGVQVKDEQVEVTFAELLPETTFCFLIRAGYQDNHRVASDEQVIFYFATTDTMQSGSVSGRIFFKEDPDSTGVAKLFEIRADSTVDVRREQESRIAFAGWDGVFTFRALPTDGTPFILWAFQDKNSDGVHQESEFSFLHPDTIRLAGRFVRTEDIMIKIIDPNEPGRVEGSIINVTGVDSMLTVRLDPVLQGERPIVSSADSTGRFLLMPVPPGGYLFSAFIDLQPDSLCGDFTGAADSILAEPCWKSPDTLIVAPGELKTLEQVTLE